MLLMEVPSPPANTLARLVMVFVMLEIITWGVAMMGGTAVYLRLGTVTALILVGSGSSSLEGRIVSSCIIHYHKAGIANLAA